MNSGHAGLLLHEQCLSERLNHCQLPFAGAVLQDQGTGWLHKSMKGSYFIKLSEMIKIFLSKSAKEKMRITLRERTVRAKAACSYVMT